jgi:hypothetical protein
MEPKSELYQSVPATRPVLKVGVLLDELSAPSWIAKILADIESSGFADLRLAVVNSNVGPVRPKGSRLHRLLHSEVGFLYYRFLQLEKKKYPAFHEPFVDQDLAPFFKGKPVLAVTPIRRKFVDRFMSDDIAKIKAFDLDVVLRFGFNIIRGEILTCARYGVWSFHHGDITEYRGGPAHFWEVYERNPISGVILQVLTETLYSGDVIYRSYGATGSELWPSQNKFYTYLKASAFVLRCLRRLALDGDAGLPIEASDQKYGKRLYREPTNIEMVPFLARIMLSGARNRFQRRFQQEQWFIAFRKAEAPSGTVPTAQQFTEVMPPRDRFFADPFVISHGGSNYILFEDFDYRRQRGKISFITVSDTATASSVATALELDHHMSYPFTFKWNDQIFMIPETGQQRVVQLFRAIEFPTRWQFIGNLLTGWQAFDATLFEHDRSWFMFVNVSESGGWTCDELFLFVAEAPVGPWRPHPKNPIKSDVRSARPAGNILTHNGRLLRPAQDCSGTYGRAIVFSEIHTLTTSDYEERVVGSIEPTWAKGITGTHTFSTNGVFDAIDAKRYVAR